MRKKQALIISFEGIEGSGKSTQCRLLTNYLRKLGLKVAIFREPGSSKVGEKIRQILLHSKGKLTHFCETMLFIAARGQLTAEKIKPLLAKKDVIILDRYIDATVAYQGYGSGVDLKLINQLNIAAADEIIPKLTILMDVAPKIGLRRSGRTDRFEKRKLSFHNKVRHGYLQLAKKNPRRIKKFSSQEPMDKVQAKIREFIDHELKC